MKVRVPYKILESVLRPLMEADAVPEQKSLEQQFKDKVDVLNAMKDGSPFSTADAKFEKRSGSWYMVSAGGRTGIDTETLLSLVRSDQVDDVRAKIEADKKSGGTTGITIQGSQFEPATTTSATFQLDNGYWKDMTPVPVEILAQYDFQMRQGVDASETAVYASVHGVTGQGPFTYTRDEIVYLITKEGALYILAEGNKDNTLEATRNLITKVDPVGRIASTGRSGIFKEKSDNAKLLSMLETLRKYLPDESGESRNRFDVAIKDLKGLGELQKAIADQRTLVGKFVDLFGVNEIEMTFVMSQWGPALMRAQVFGGRGTRGGAGGLTSSDITGLMSTGLFVESSPADANVSTYVPNVSNRQRLIRSGSKASPISVTPQIPSGVKVDGVSGLLNALQEDPKLSYKDSFADAYFLYSNGVLTHEGASTGEEAEPSTEAPAPAPAPEPTPPPGDTLDDFLRKNKNKEVVPGAAYFKFDKFNLGETDTYVDAVTKALNEVQSKYNITTENTTQIFTIVGCTDPVGTVSYNKELATKRAEELLTKITPKMSGLVTGDFAVPGESPWVGMQIAKEKNTPANDPQRELLRFAKVYWGKVTEDEATKLAKDFALKTAEEKSVTLNERKSSLAESQLRAHIRRILLNG